MDYPEFRDWLMRQKGVVRVEAMPPDLVNRIVSEESTVRSSFGTEVVNSGLDQCLERGCLVVAFVDEDFWEPQETSMLLRNSDGTVIGHDVPRSRIHEFEGRDDIMFISDGFVMMMDRPMDSAPYMEMLSRRYSGDDGSLPDDVNAVIWFPSPTSSDIIHDAFGQPDTGLATAMLGVDLFGTCTKS